MSFPYDFGMVKDTKGEDGDCVDVIVITEYDTYPGVQIKCWVIGALMANQRSPGKKANYWGKNCTKWNHPHKYQPDLITETILYN